jgi:hypothetical protein
VHNFFTFSFEKQAAKLLKLSCNYRFFSLISPKIILRDFQICGFFRNHDRFFCRKGYTFYGIFLGKTESFYTLKSQNWAVTIDFLVWFVLKLICAIFKFVDFSTTMPGFFSGKVYTFCEIFFGKTESFYTPDS